MDNGKVFMVLNVWHTKKMNNIYEFIFSSRRRTKRMDNGQVFMFTRKKDGRPDLGP